MVDSIVINMATVQSYKWVKEKLNDFKIKRKRDTSQINFVLLIPVYKEQKNIRKIIEHFIKLRFSREFKVIFIASNQEQCVDENNRTTLDCVNTYLDEYNQKYTDNKFLCITYPYKNDNKARKLNYALEVLGTRQFEMKSTYIGVYDADSRPDLDTLLAIEVDAIKEYERSGEYPIAYQQPSYFINNFDDLGLYLKLEALSQTRWCFGHEIRTQRQSNEKCKYKIPYAYCVGHGMFIRYDLLDKYGFSEPIEDVPMGFRLDFMNIPIIPIWLFDYAEVVTSIKKLILQSGRWAQNAFLVFREAKSIKKLKIKINVYRKMIILIKGIGDVFSWLHYLLCFTTAIILSIIFSSCLFIFMFFICSFFDAGIGTLIMGIILKNKIWKEEVSGYRYLIKMAKLIFISPFRGIIRGLAPFLALLYFGQEVYTSWKLKIKLYDKV